MPRRRRKGWEELGDGWDEVPPGWDIIMVARGVGPIEASRHLPGMTKEDLKMLVKNLFRQKKLVNGTPITRAERRELRNYVTADGFRFVADDDEIEDYADDIADAEFRRYRTDVY